MNIRVNWKELLIHLTLWVAAEMILNLTGLNDLSNYSEFVSRQNRLELWRA